MIVGTGIDLVSVSRIARWLDDKGLCRRFFHSSELAEVRNRGSGAPSSLAARFAAKEAFVKALGTGFAGMRLKDIRVENSKSGRPTLVLRGRAKTAMESTGANRAHISLTHEGNIAIAAVILEAVDG